MPSSNRPAGFAGVPYDELLKRLRALETTAVAEIDAALGDLALRRASSDAVFERGMTYAHSGAVSMPADQGGVEMSAKARVIGTDTYTTEVRLADAGVAGDCDCPHGRDGWFCKHQVAVALVWRARLAGTEPAVDEAARKKVLASAKRAQTVKDRHRQLHDFLHAQPAAALADRLIELADRDPGLARRLQQWRKVSEAPASAAELKKLVGEILDSHHAFIPWDGIAGYLQQAEAALPLIEREIARDPKSGMGLALHALRRAWRVLAQADDSNGEIGDLCASIGAQWLAALQAAGAQPAAFGDAYLALRLEDPFGCFDQAAAEAAMGAAALGRFRKSLADRWRQAKDAEAAERIGRGARYGAKNSFGLVGRDALDMRLSTLERMHLEQLEAAGDIDGALAAMREDLSESWAFVRVTGFLERHGRLREAFASAEQGCRRFPDDERLEEDLLRCCERDGCVDEALALCQRRFDRRPSVERYHALLAAAEATGRPREVVRGELMADLQHLESAPARSGGLLFGPLGSTGNAAGGPDVSLRAAILCSEQRWRRPACWWQPPARCRPETLAAIARHLAPGREEERIALLLRVFGAAMNGAKSPYAEPLRIVEEIDALMTPERRRQWLGELRAEHRARRNFVAGLPAS